jgi:Uma2 family endonuclease
MNGIDLKHNSEVLEIPAAESVSEDGKFVSEKEYWEKYYEHPDFNYEWNNGILEEKPVSDVKNITMYYWFIRLLGYYLETTERGKAVFHDFGFRLALPGGTSIRKPDFAVVLIDNTTSLEQDDRSFKGVFDLCVELISDATQKDIIRDTTDKKNEYEIIGVKEYYILDASNIHMAFYWRSRGIFVPLRLIDGDIIQSEALKGFQFRVSHLFTQPPIEELVEDKVYYDYVIPAYRTIKLRAEAAKKNAEAAKQEAEEEKMRADSAEKKAEEEKMRADSAEKKAEAAKKEAEQEKVKAEAARKEAEQEKVKAEAARKEAEQEKVKAEAARKEAEQEKVKAEAARKEAEYEKIKVERLAAKLRSLGISPD